MTNLKLKIVIDSSISYLKDVEDALERQKAVYERVSGGKLTIDTHIVREDLSGLPWVESHLNAKYVDPTWLRRYARSDDEYGIVYVFDFSNWQAPGISGWSMGFYNRHHVQLIKGNSKNEATDNIYSMFVTFHEELLHGFDEFLWYELGISLEQILNVGDFDYDIVHAKRWNYDKELKIIIPYLIKILNKYMEPTEKEVRTTMALMGMERDEEAEKYWSKLPREKWHDQLVKDRKERLEGL